MKISRCIKLCFKKSLVLFLHVHVHIYIHILALIDEKLGEMEEFYSSKRDENFRIGATAMEERLMSFQRQLEERYRTDLKLEVRQP